MPSLIDLLPDELKHLAVQFGDAGMNTAPPKGPANPLISLQPNTQAVPHDADVAAKQAPMDYNRPSPQPVNPFQTKEHLADEKAAREAEQSTIDEQKSTTNKMEQMLQAYMTGDQGKVDLSPLLALSDAWSGGNQAKSYKAPEDQQTKMAKAIGLENEIGQRRNDASKSQNALAKLLSDNKMASAWMGMQGRNQKFDQTEWDKLNESIDPNGRMAGELKRQAARLNDAKAVEVMGAQFPTGMIPNGQFAETAGAVAKLMGAGNAAAAETINRYVPETMRSRAADIQQWWESTATPSDRKSFMAYFMDTARREREQAQKNINEAMYSRLGAKQHLQNSDPARWDRVLAHHGLDPRGYDAWAGGGYQDSVLQNLISKGRNIGPSAAGLSLTPQNSADEQAKQWAMQNPTDPRAQAIMSHLGR